MHFLRNIFYPDLYVYLHIICLWILAHFLLAGLFLIVHVVFLYEFCLNYLFNVSFLAWGRKSFFLSFFLRIVAVMHTGCFHNFFIIWHNLKITICINLSTNLKLPAKLLGFLPCKSDICENYQCILKYGSTFKRLCSKSHSK